MDIFESLENLNVSEECFDEIMDITERILDTVYGKSSTTMEPTKPDVKPYKKNFSSKAEAMKKASAKKKTLARETKPVNNLVDMSKKRDGKPGTSAVKSTENSGNSEYRKWLHHKQNGVRGIDRDINTKGYEEQRDAKSEYSPTHKYKVKNPPNYNIMDTGSGNSVNYENGWDSSSSPYTHKEETEVTNAKSINKHYKKKGAIKTGKDSAIAYKAKQALKNYREKHGKSNHLTNALRNAHHREVMADYYYDATH